MKKIVFSLMIFLMCWTVSAQTSDYIPENIAYYEYCYMSGQCDIPDEVEDLIVMNILSIKFGMPSVY